MKTQFTLAVILVLTIAVLWLPLAATPTLASPADQASEARLTLTANGVVRAWPSHDMEALGAIPARSIVPATGRTPDSAWWRISYPGGPDGNGWLPSNVVQPNEFATSVPVIQVVFATPTPAPVLPTPSPTPQGCTYDSSFVADVTIPDNTQVSPNQQVDKVWRLSNIGSCPWDNGTVLAFVTGFKLNAPDSVAVPPTAPGATADIGVSMYAPEQPGSYTGIWQLKNAQGEFFGHRVNVTIDVPQNNPPPPPPNQPTINFWADTYQISPGQCTNIHWDVQNVKAVYLEHNNRSYGVAGQDSKSVCPCNDGKTYTLHVFLQDGSQQDRQFKININGSCSGGGGGGGGGGEQKIKLWASPNPVNKGQCTTVYWEVNKLHKIHFDNRTFMDGHSSTQVCPKSTTRYPFTVCYDASCGPRDDYSIKIKVN